MTAVSNSGVIQVTLCQVYSKMTQVLCPAKFIISQKKSEGTAVSLHFFLPRGSAAIALLACITKASFRISTWILGSLFGIFGGVSRRMQVE